MSDREFFIYTVTDELPRFERVFEALPKNRLNYRPEPKSRTAKELAETIAGESAMFSAFLKKGVIDFSKFKMPVFKDVNKMKSVFSKNLKDLKKIVSDMNQSRWSSEAKMVTGNHVDWKTTKSKMAWGLLLDLIHHRGQLSTYIRPMGSKVPSIYGPSADSQS